MINSENKESKVMDNVSEKYKTLFSQNLLAPGGKDLEFKKYVDELKVSGFDTTKMWNDMWLTNQLKDIETYKIGYVEPEKKIQEIKKHFTYTIGGL